MVDECDGVHGRVRAGRAAASLCFVLAAEARKLSLSASLGWAEEAHKRHARNGDGDAAIIEFLNYPLCVSVASLGCRGTWPIELVTKLQGCLRLSVRTRCGFLKSKILRFGSVRFWKIGNPTVRFGAV